jgi:phosphoribosylamine--glycine ligase
LKVLVIGSGGREHALVWAMSKSPKVKTIYCYPGNAGIVHLAECPKLPSSKVSSIADWAQAEQIDLTVVGPEAYLAQGIVDEFEGRGLRIFGPSKRAAQLESSKVFAKELMRKYGIPTADYRVFSDLEKALDYVTSATLPIVIKADGLAAGKGVIVAATREVAQGALLDLMADKVFGQAGEQVVIEEFLQGEEASLLAFTDGKTIIPMVSAQDHKQIYEGGQGPNTGGMGAYSPTPVLNEALIQEVYNQILVPTVAGLRKEGILYKGVIYAGLMVHQGKAKVVEFNCRFGDPEAQVVLTRLLTDLVDVMDAVIDECLEEIELRWDQRAAVCVILASGGYPGEYRKGYPISGLADVEGMQDVYVFHSGTRFEDEDMVTDGGRVLGVTALDLDVSEAIKRTYAAVEQIQFKDAYYRKDIASRALESLD